MSEETDVGKPADATSESSESSSSPAPSSAPGAVPQTAAPRRGPTPAPKAKPQPRRLAKSIGMAMPSNRFRVFLGRGAIPPVSEKKHFVARLRSVDRVEIVILEGDEDQADRNVFVGEIGLSNVKLREDGRAEIEVEFTIGDKGILTVVVLDRVSGTESVGRFVSPQFADETRPDVDLGGIPVEELSQKIDLLEQQMQLLKGELMVRRERDGTSSGQPG